ncbi:immunoglobulin-like domain-containing protein [Zobellia russellii]|uniref:immunoglobulin-like domain-containing protein n=1 Tax=Zobellia russellii TaxID=248907 RepID=UPI0037DD410E
MIPPDRVPVTGISVSQADPGATGAQRQLAATVLPENATDPSVTWSSADDTIATVDENGLLTGLSAGTVTITATSVSDPEVSGSVLVEITGVSLQSANDIEAFALNGQIETATIDTQAHTVSVTVPEGTALNVAPVLLIVSEGATLSPALLQVRDFTSPVQYTVTSGNGTGQVWTVTAKVLVLPVAGDTDITAFGLPGQNGSDIDTGNHTITVNVPDGTDLNIAPEILEVSPGASVAPAIGQVRDFSGAVAYTVTPETGTPQVWTVNVTVSQPTGSGENAITAFELPGQTGADINATTFTINVTVPDGTDLTGAPSVLDISADATVSPARTVLQDFSGAVTYTVTAENGDTQEWTVNTTVLPPTGSGANDITAFGLPVQNSADIDPGTNTVTVNVPDGTDLNVAPQVLGVSPGATVLPAIGAVQDFSGQVLYTVTAENGTPQVWTVNVTVSQPTGSAENDIVAFELPLQNSSTIDTDNNIISVNVDTGVPLNITPSIFNVSPSASVSPATTTVQDFSSTVTYVVTAENGNEKTWQVNVTLSPDDTPPVITLAGSNPQELTLGGTYNELGATATDNVDGDISANVISDATAVNMNVAGTYTVTYNVSDAAGNAATQVTRTVNVSAAPDTTPPVIALTGGEVNLTVGDTYVDPGYSATDNVDGDITGSVIVGGVVNTGVPGDYVVTYDVNDIAGNPAIQKTRIIEVRSPVDDTNPEINLFGGTMNLMVGDTYVDLGYYAIDDVDGDITDNVIVSGLPNMNVANSYTVTYDVSDQAGNPAPQKTRTVNVIAALDETAPEITLVGGTVSQTRGGTYVDPGYSATDNIDGDITANVVVSGLPNMSVVGSYTVTYNVSDVAGNPAPQKTRRVNVTAPQVTITYNSTTGVYTAPAGSRVMVTLRSQGAGKGNATVSGGGGSASTSWNGRNDTDEFSEIDSYEFTMPPSGSVTFSSNHREIFGDSDSRVTITNNQGGAEGFTVEKNGGIP